MPSPPFLKRFGQHHLVDPKLCRPLVDFLASPPSSTAGALAGTRVVEIGPGGGVLTGVLLAAGARVLALEVDPAWAFELRRRLPHRELLAVLGDALTFPWQRLPAPTLVAGNLPYNVATAILSALLPHHRNLPRAAFLVQREVAERLAARPGEKPYGALSVLVGARAEVHLLGRVRPGSFRPPPKVEGAFVGLRLVAPPLPEGEMEAFEATVRLAFAQRRKRLRNALAAGWGREGAAAALTRAGIDPGRRAEELALEDFLALHRARDPATAPGPSPSNR